MAESKLQVVVRHAATDGRRWAGCVPTLYRRAYHASPVANLVDPPRPLAPMLKEGRWVSLWRRCQRSRTPIAHTRSRGLRVPTQARGHESPLGIAKVCTHQESVDHSPPENTTFGERMSKTRNTKWITSLVEAGLVGLAARVWAESQWRRTFSDGVNATVPMAPLLTRKVHQSDCSAAGNL